MTHPLFFEVTLIPCPWCNRTPAMRLDLHSKDAEILADDCGGTWVWCIECCDTDCPFHPKGRTVSIRKSQRFSLDKIKKKLDLLCCYWNACSHSTTHKPYEKTRIPLEKWIEFINKNKNSKYYK